MNCDKSLNCMPIWMFIYIPHELFSFHKSVYHGMGRSPTKGNQVCCSIIIDLYKMTVSQLRITSKGCEEVIQV